MTNTHSPRSHRYLIRQRRREIFRRFRVGLLLLLLAVTGLWAWETHLADHRVFAWDRPIQLAVVAVVEGEESQESRWFIQDFLSRSSTPRRNLRSVERWIQSEYERHSGDDLEILDVSVRGPVLVDERPPVLPTGEDSFYRQWKGIRDFLGYFREIHGREELLLGAQDVTVFVYFYDDDDPVQRAAFERFDSVASRRDGIGIVFAPLGRSRLGWTTAVVAHEILHTLGASDKYEGRTSVYPQGFAEPDREPRYPQRRGEIMSLGRPVSPGVDEAVRSLKECIVGEVTAGEINWTGSR